MNNYTNIEASVTNHKVNQKENAMEGVTTLFAFPWGSIVYSCIVL